MDRSRLNPVASVAVPATPHAQRQTELCSPAVSGLRFHLRVLTWSLKPSDVLQLVIAACTGFAAPLRYDYRILIPSFPTKNQPVIVSIFFREVIKIMIPFGYPNN